ncbi:MAG: glycosyltransferase family 4 protein [Gammaproteobacteria bacterium]|nr:glycosyltransferase family 4 protein [Gammaproteobacteria bacterium]
MRKYKTLVISNLYPSAEFPGRGVFTEHRIRNLVKSGRVETRVLCPLPWFPLRGERFGQYGAFARVGGAGERHGIAINYPKYPVVPKVGTALSGLFMALSLFRAARRQQRNGFEFDVIDAYYFYPDGVAAALVGKWLRKPVVITAYGSDLNILPDHPLVRAQIRWAAAQAAGLTTVCGALKDVLVDLGTPADKVRVVLHGVDLALFRPVEDRATLRQRLGLSGPVCLSVGNLVELKGHDLTIRAVGSMTEGVLLIAGDGPEAASLKALVERERLEDRVRFLGRLSQAELVDYYCAADAFVLSSSREGIANVIMESMACGTPVVATAVGGAPEVITVPEAGLLVDRRTPEAIADAIGRLLADPPDRAATRRFAEQFTWERTTADHLAVLDGVITGTDKPD